MIHRMLSVPFVWSSPDESVRLRVGEILESWEGTRYMAGCQAKQRGVDCVRFIAAVIDELTGTNTPIKAMPQDIAIHNPAKAQAAAKLLLSHFNPVMRVTDGVVNPGDVLVVGASGGGPGHCMIVGHEENTIWQSDNYVGVHKGGFGLFRDYQILHRIYRLGNLETR